MRFFPACRFPERYFYRGFSPLARGVDSFSQHRQQASVGTESNSILFDPVTLFERNCRQFPSRIRIPEPHRRIVQVCRCKNAPVLTEYCGEEIFGAGHIRGLQLAPGFYLPTPDGSISDRNYGAAIDAELEGPRQRGGSY